jgi:hypothetical protein
MATSTSAPKSERDSQPLPASTQETERRIRWERQSDKAQRLVIQDAITGKVLAVVGSLFDIRRV